MIPSRSIPTPRRPIPRNSRTSRGPVLEARRWTQLAADLRLHAAEARLCALREQHERARRAVEEAVEAVGDAQQDAET